MVEERLVAKSVFMAHTHSYTRVSQLGCDADDKWGSPVWVSIIPDSEVHVAEGGYSDLEAVGIETVTSETSTPS